MSDTHHDRPAPSGSPWPSVVLALACAALVAGALAWRAHDALGIVHGATRFHAIDERLATAGWLTTAAPAALKDAGFEVVIDLRTAKEQGAAAERAAVEAAGLRYVSAPVGGPPTRAQFEAFSAALAAEDGRRVLVHCASNKRASTMVMLDRVVRRGVAEAEARRDLEAVWRPSPAYEKFIAGMMAAAPPATTAPEK